MSPLHFQFCTKRCVRTISQSYLTIAIWKLSCDRVLEAGKDYSVFDMPIPMFDLRASSASAGLAHEEKIFSLCSLDRDHTAPGQRREPDPHLHITNPSPDSVWGSS